MAIITNTFQAGSDNSLREDLTDTVYRISPYDTIFSTSAQKAKAYNTAHQWQTHSLAAASTSNAHAEGDDITSFDAITATTKLTNRCQIFIRDFVISDTDDAVRHAGLKSIIAFMTTAKGQELRRDIEATLLANQAEQTASGNTPGKFASVLSWIKTNTNKDAGGSDPATADGAAVRTDSGTLRSFNEAQVKSVWASLFSSSSAKPDMMLLPPLLKQSFSTFAANSTRMMDASKEKLFAGISIYQGDFGTIEISPSRFMRTRDALLINSSLWALAWLRPIALVDLAKTGDATKKMCRAELSLEARNEAGNAGIFDLQQ